ncbi:hypothetical protein CYMTET_56374 [Cymbomonas tetramitiformis]|uniref:Uncharacterized protein n=1 Tax=Cymbomonas tetramitiformis TaxID=36881 RepID=A0AAE0BC94_9CHLO|nr:hypothetical protein CYMTET_56374 [Cymbomonas tetramitiformis]
MDECLLNGERTEGSDCCQPLDAEDLVTCPENFELKFDTSDAGVCHNGSVTWYRGCCHGAKQEYGKGRIDVVDSQGCTVGYAAVSAGSQPYDNIIHLRTGGERNTGSVLTGYDLVGQGQCVPDHGPQGDKGTHGLCERPAPRRIRDFTARRLCGKL